MPSIPTLLQFALASVLLAVTPGPSVVLLLAVGADRGRRASVATAIGLAGGTFTWGLVTAAGLGALLAARPGLLSLVTAAGGSYLLVLGGLRLRAARADEVTLEAPPPPRRGSALRDGLVVNLLNPSITVFLASIVPPFLDVDAGPVWQQILVLSGVLVVASTIVNVGYGLLGAAVGRRARRWVGSRTTAAVAGVAYVLLGLVALAAAVLR